ncbi:RHS repeat-associated core domain-containing protein [Rhizobium terrae]|uniref:RHS repeat-associated core domain-containing protein n=1 Tax=Rhizobium terrae TaxID=2171756 RepID=UPI000E3BF36E|nr:RHS repeat-associated core domain-containing protein [Rhizobium terrae]
MQTKKGYIGERLDVETGLMYLNARYYDPAFGRFVPRDEGQDLINEGSVFAKGATYARIPVFGAGRLPESLMPSTLATYAI